MIVNEELLKSARTKKGGYSSAQIKFAQDYTGKPAWLKSLVGLNVSDLFWSEFIKLRSSKVKQGQPKKPINAMSKSDGWEWKPKAIDIPVIKKLKPKTGKKAKRKLVTKLDNANFYLSDEWRAIRVRVLEKYECKCMMCGRSPRMHNIVIHVDHIKPRSKHPELSLEITNLQLLCEDCNKGKSNRYDTDWRPDLDEINIVLDAMRLI